MACVYGLVLPWLNCCQPSGGGQPANRRSCCIHPCTLLLVHLTVAAVSLRSARRQPRRPRRHLRRRCVCTCCVWPLVRVAAAEEELEAACKRICIGLRPPFKQHPALQLLLLLLLLLNDLVSLGLPPSSHHRPHRPATPPAHTNRPRRRPRLPPSRPPPARRRRCWTRTRASSTPPPTTTTASRHWQPRRPRASTHTPTSSTSPPRSPITWQNMPASRRGRAWRT